MVGVFAYLKACCFLGLIIHGTHWTNYSCGRSGDRPGPGGQWRSAPSDPVSLGELGEAVAWAHTPVRGLQTALPWTARGLINIQAEALDKLLSRRPLYASVPAVLLHKRGSL